jgi:hypothetical protein
MRARTKGSPALGREQNQEAIFLAALGIFAMVALVLYFGSGARTAPTPATVVSVPATTSRIVAPSAAVLVLVTPTSVPTLSMAVPAALTARDLPLATPADSVAMPTTLPPTVMPADTPDTSSLPAIDATPITIQTMVVKVGNTSGQGVFLRKTPRLSDRWIAWPDRTPLVLLGDTAEGDGQHWLEVRDPKSNIGWVPAQYLVQ